MPQNLQKLHERDAKVMPELARHIGELADLSCIRTIIPDAPKHSPRISDPEKVIAYPNSATPGRDGFHAWYICSGGSQAFTIFVDGETTGEVMANYAAARHYVLHKHGDGHTEITGMLSELEEEANSPPEDEEWQE